ncbi:MAG TPA: ATP-binding cassette domain-containing protein [Cytophagales bacterium]|nr:ATP-binding cassette domain-containing protein [Cytophagales bacterium]
MSEEILKALTQLFAIITKQDGGVTENERDYIIRFFQQELDKDSVKEYVDLYDQFVGYNVEDNGEVKVEKKLTSVKDSVKTLAICKKINKTLTQKQKVIVLIKILELVASDKNLAFQRMEIIDTISNVFNIGKDEFKLIEAFVLTEDFASLDFSDLLVVNSEPIIPNPQLKHIFTENLNGTILFMKVDSVDLYFVKYIGKDDLILNGFIVKYNHVYLFSNGSTIKGPKSAPLYYSDLIVNFQADFKANKLSFNAKALEYKFKNGGIGLRNVNISEGPGKLIGIMGASGAGKTTLLNVLAGIESPTDGEVLINGINIHKEKDKIQGVIGYVSQDDLLIEELTVYQNLYYNAKLCFKDLNEAELDKRVIEVLSSLGLEQRKDLKVGSVLDKTISGGQRKRLNIALELIREPAVMFVDEPTSGLSSRDSENVIDLLKELSLKGKLIFVVIHQPSSDIYKMFDKMFIMDTGGYPIFYGNPVEAVTYFKKATHQVDSERGQCGVCGNVNPEQIFNIIEAKVVDEYGQFTNKRKVNPQQWNELFTEKFKLDKTEDIKEQPPKNLKIPSKLKQILIFTTRDFLSKISNKQYLIINLLEAPLLAFLLAFVIRYKNVTEGGAYVYRFNENIPAFILIAIVVALFMGLTVSAEEIIKDRKILKREAFLNLSRTSYLCSKLSILFFLSAIQTLSFVLLGNYILEIDSMTFSYWLALFSISCFANVLGLNVSSAFNSAVTVYIIIPLLLIPQMVLSGLLFSFDKLNNMISTKGKVPIIADLMASRWAYEAIAVYHYKNNPYQASFYTLEKETAVADFKEAYWLPQVLEKITFSQNNYKSTDDSVKREVALSLDLIKNELAGEKDFMAGNKLDLDKVLSMEGFNDEVAGKLRSQLEALEKFYLEKFSKAESLKERFIALKESKFDFKLNDFKDKYFNESLSDLVRNVNAKDRIIEYENRLLKQSDPVYTDPVKPASFLDYRTHFFAPVKHMFGVLYDTFYFNIIVIWLMSLILYFALYFEVFKKIIEIFSK